MKRLDLLENKIISIFIIVFLILVDQITKYLARLHLQEKSFVLINNFLQLTYVENRGAAFGLLQGMQWVFAILSVFVLFGLIYFYKEQKKKNLQGLSMLYWIIVFIIAGAIGNLIDRVAFGYVTDMIDVFGIWNYIFNVADIYIVCSFIALSIYMLIYDIERKI